MSEEKGVYTTSSNIAIETPCLVCGEPVRIEWHARAPKICDKCKQAILHVRVELDNA